LERPSDACDFSFLPLSSLSLLLLLLLLLASLPLSLPELLLLLPELLLLPDPLPLSDPLLLLLLLLEELSGISLRSCFKRLFLRAADSARICFMRNSWTFF
jgi:hypothetical protein